MDPRHFHFLASNVHDGVPKNAVDWITHEALGAAVEREAVAGLINVGIMEIRGAVITVKLDMGGFG